MTEARTASAVAQAVVCNRAMNWVLRIWVGAIEGASSSTMSAAVRCLPAAGPEVDGGVVFAEAEGAAESAVARWSESGEDRRGEEAMLR